MDRPIRFSAGVHTVETIDDAHAVLVGGHLVEVHGVRYAHCTIHPRGHITAGPGADIGYRVSNIVFEGNHLQCLAHAMGLDEAELEAAKKAYHADIAAFCAEFFGGKDDQHPTR